MDKVKPSFVVKDSGVLIFGEKNTHTLQVDPSAWKTIGDEGVVIGSIATVLSETDETGVATVCLLSGGELRCYASDEINAIVENSELGGNDDAGSDHQD